jgi:ubiquinone/menaquinone biosynthesis C-methylase UbiE
VDQYLPPSLSASSPFPFVAVILIFFEGIVTEELHKKFTKVIGTDPSEKMLSAVTSHESLDGKPPIDYKVASAEELSFIESGSVDMVTAGQAAHWFKHEKSFPEITRILKPGGTLAFFCISPINIRVVFVVQVSWDGTF